MITMRAGASVLLILLLAGCASKGPLEPARYSTPEETFMSWRRAVEALDLNRIVDTYAQSAQPRFRQEIASTTKEGLEAMQKEARNTDFAIEKIVFEDQRAYLRIRRKIGKESEIEVVNMVKEGNQWKILP